MISFLEFLNEGASFELAGKKYSSAFGRYKCDGKDISREDYLKASQSYKASTNTKTSKHTAVSSFSGDSGKQLADNIGKDIANKLGKVKVQSMSDKAIVFQSDEYKGLDTFDDEEKIERVMNNLRAVTKQHSEAAGKKIVPLYNSSRGEITIKFVG